MAKYRKRNISSSNQRQSRAQSRGPIEIAKSKSANSNNNCGDDKLTGSCCFIKDNIPTCKDGITCSLCNSEYDGCWSENSCEDRIMNEELLCCYDCKKRSECKLNPPNKQKFSTYLKSRNGIKQFRSRVDGNIMNGNMPVGLGGGNEDDRSFCYTNLGWDPNDRPDDCPMDCVHTNWISLTPIRADFIPGSCPPIGPPLRSAVTFSAQWTSHSENEDCCGAWEDGKHPRAFIRYTVRTFDNPRDMNEQYRGMGQFEVYSCKDNINMGDIQSVVVNPHSELGGTGIPLNEDKTAWVQIDIDAPVTASLIDPGHGRSHWDILSHWGGNCYCGVADLPCACPGLLTNGCVVNGQQDFLNKFLPASSDVMHKWEAPTLNVQGAPPNSCCKGCPDPTQIPGPNPNAYRGCQLMYKGMASACSKNPNPDLSAGGWNLENSCCCDGCDCRQVENASECVDAGQCTNCVFYENMTWSPYNCGNSYNFWLKAEDN